ncbi:RecJ like exonuclease [Halobacteriales archaeon QS_5_70_15]|nr:MAG: RecJ like exonuclease [Halobacteriales archaeon QS_5_70_15]
MSPSSDSDAGGSGDAVPGPGTTVYELAPGCTVEDVEIGEYYHATVNGVVDYGVFVDLSQEVSGLVHSSNLRGEHDVGDDLIVELLEVRENGDLSFAGREPQDYETVRVEGGEGVGVPDIEDAVGRTVHLEGEVVQIKQTGGPTLFFVRDGAGVVPCAAFEEAGVRAYPNVELDDSLARLRGEAAAEVHERVEAKLDERAEPPEIEPLVDWPAFEKLRPGLRDVARRLREAALGSRPIRMRHHADGDGMCASIPLQTALESFIAETHEDPQAPRHMLKRLPSKAPFYEMEDVTRDLNFALEDRERHGQRLPLLLMLDNGSTEEDTPAYRALDQYDIPILVVDHHHPDPEAVAPLVEAHVNPYLHDEDYRITTGMMSIELARLIDPDITDDVRHIPAVAGLADRSRAETMDGHFLRYSAGRHFINDVLNVDCDDPDRHRELVSFLSSRAERDVDRQLGDAMAHVESRRLENGAHLFTVDLDEHAHRFTYPAPGKTTGKIHDTKVEETGGDPVITIGYGPDFAVLRSDGVRLDIPQMVSELSEEVDGGGVSGGGHLVVGSIKFVAGMREEVVDALVEKMGEAELDEALRSTLVRED